MATCASHLKICEYHTDLSLHIMHKEALIYSEIYQINRDTRDRENIQEIRLLVTLFRGNHPKFSF